MILTHHGINSLSRVAVGDCLYADANGKKHFVNPDAIPSPLPEGWEFVGVVALIDGSKATVIYKTENTSVKWSSMWLFKVNGLKLDGTDSFVLQQNPATGSTPVEVGTFTATAAATDLDTLVDELDEWLRDNPTAPGALSNYNWHAEKHKDANGVDSCFIVVDNTDSNGRFVPIKSSTSGAYSSLYMWTWFLKSALTTQLIKRKDGVMTYAVVWNKDRFKAYNTNFNSPTDSLTSVGLFNEAGFNATTVLKEYYGTYDNYLEYMMVDEEATVGTYYNFKGKGRECADALIGISFKNIEGTDTPVFIAEEWAASIKAHSTASVEGLNAGDFIVPSIDTAYKILSAMKLDGSDPVNSALVKAGESAFSLNQSRWCPVYFSISGNDSFVDNRGGYFANNFFGYTSNRTIAVAEINL